eukprot:523160-Pyramimonas_sp.AAC.1
MWYRSYAVQVQQLLCPSCAAQCSAIAMLAESRLCGAIAVAPKLYSGAVYVAHLLRGANIAACPRSCH